MAPHAHICAAASRSAGALRCSPVSRSMPNHRSHATTAGQVNWRSVRTVKPALVWITSGWSRPRNLPAHSPANHAVCRVEPWPSIRGNG